MGEPVQQRKVDILVCIIYNILSFSNVYQSNHFFSILNASLLSVYFVVFQKQTFNMKCNNIFTMISNSIPGFRGSFSFVIKYQYLVVLKLLLPNLFISFQDKKPFQSENTKSNKSKRFSITGWS